MNITISSSGELMWNGVAGRLAGVAQALASVVRVRSSRAAIDDGGSAGHQAEQRERRERARLDAAARSTFAVLHQ